MVGARMCIDLFPPSQLGAISSEPFSTAAVDKVVEKHAGIAANRSWPRVATRCSQSGNRAAATLKFNDLSRGDRERSSSASALGVAKQPSSALGTAIARDTPRGNARFTGLRGPKGDKNWWSPGAGGSTIDSLRRESWGNRIFSTN
ncbi:hypothetical protein QTH97_33405 [Variovorax sp. J22R24]|uniref:hypothetical protein n=1 Tax=Variovorax gracilis TaxID=3053502 RepID=UPI002578E698|nr:hypothetical protein [Variovorax sp. J22R24]MDM0109853.1 hypothetical protein [Variovorax sp. J22R24]